MKKERNNYAFIDGTNLHLSSIAMGWKIDWKRLKKHLEEKYGVAKAYYFIGYVENNQNLYDALKSRGYELVFKKTFSPKEGELKGNIDAELVLQSMIDYRVYKEAIIVTSDGDFACLVKYLRLKNKLREVIASSKEGCSHLLQEAAGTYISYIDDLKNKLEYKK
jgi:uncharacterized LabA/DUF88 family protein